tara:strand:- start:38582 stop:38881 length:300 start_codon:yes stop_codon:yes gene_type:complete
MIGRTKCVTAVCRRTIKDEIDHTVWLCGRCMKSVDSALRAAFKQHRRARQAFYRRWRGKRKPYRSAHGNWRAYLALRHAEWAAFIRCIQDAKIKRVLDA